MRYIFLLTLTFTLSFCDIFSMNSFEADFKQVVTNENGNKLEYSGHIKAMKPQYALWQYVQPSSKFIYINKYKATIIEPELEQVVIKKLHNSIDFFEIIKNATQIDKNRYTTKFQSVNYTINLVNSQLQSIEYKDQFDNNISIRFFHPKINKEMSTKDFEPTIPLEYDIIRG